MYGTRREPSWTPGPRVAAIAPSPCPHLTFSTATSVQFYMAGLSPPTRGSPFLFVGLGLSPPTRGSRRGVRELDYAWGLSPPTRGSPRGIMTPVQQRRSGLSPPTRGSLIELLAGQPDRGSIPAHAGEPLLKCSARWTNRVYPRPRGGAEGGSCANQCNGLSPPTRGSPSPWRHPPPRSRSIPAHAGEPVAVALLRGCSCGSIPAHAGEPTLTGHTTLEDRVYPRPRGGASQDMARPQGRSAEGLSPPTRGSPVQRCVACRLSVYPRPRGGAGVRVTPCPRGGLSPPTRGSH